HGRAAHGRQFPPVRRLLGAPAPRRAGRAGPGPSGVLIPGIPAGSGSCISGSPAAVFCGKSTRYALVPQARRAMTFVRPIGLVGTGFIARGFARLVQNNPAYRIAAVLTRRRPDSLPDFPCDGTITNSIDELIDRSDLVVECSGDPLHATVVVDRALSAGRPVVTMDAEFHVTTGSWFVGRGLLTEAEGDQPGCLAALHEEAVAMGFEPLVYGNMKGFLDHNPTPENMRYWAKLQGFTLNQTTSFTDGTKLQIEQALIGNGMGATISRQGLEGLRTDDTQGAAFELAALAERIGRPIADYVVSRGQPPGVFIAARHQASERGALRNIKM